MKISGFSFVRNGVKLYYPVTEMIRSILPLVDEFVIAIGKGDADDTTRADIVAIGDDKIRIIDTIWEEKYFKKGISNAIQTDIAMKECNGDWLFYLQADEVIHEKYLPVIKARCQELLDKPEIEGLLFSYRHFCGDYHHYQNGHGWYPHEIRIVRNQPEIHSYESAQSFRSFINYDNPRQPEGTRKINVASVDAEVYHYGWVRPPDLMVNKTKALETVHRGVKEADKMFRERPDYFDYGPLNYLGIFEGTHPAVMEEMIAELDWQEQLQMTGKPKSDRKLHKHERPKYRFYSWFEKTFNNGKQIGGFRNYHLLKNV